MERVEKTRDGDTDKLLSTAVVNTQPPSEATESASLMDTYGDKASSGGTSASDVAATSEELLYFILPPHLSSYKGDASVQSTAHHPLLSC
jgi:hypothetical protein